MAVRKRVLGEAHVARAEAATTDLDAHFQDLITLALLASQGQDEELIMHVKACQTTGASDEDIIQAMMHVAIYCGVPKANHAIKLIKKTLSEMDTAHE